MMNATIGIILATLSGIFNGSFTALFKTPKMTSLSLHPIIFTLYVSLGVVLSSSFVFVYLLLTERHERSLVDYVTGMGIIAGGLFVSAISASFLAVESIGVALAQGIWGGMAMLVSYTWGTLLFGEVPLHLWGSMVSLVFLIVGVCCVANCERLGEWSIQCWENVRGRNEAIDVRESLLSPSLNGRNTIETRADRTKGMLWACLVGIVGGSILAPLHYVPEDKQGLVFVPSFGFGALLTSPLILGIHILCSRGGVPPFHFKESIGTGLLSGIIYNVGNVCSILAIPVIGYKIAYPLLQCAILVSAIWGIYVFEEITRPNAIVVFWVGSFIVVFGAVLLACSK